MDLFLGRINPWFTLHMIRMSHLIRMDVNHLQSRYECLTWLTWNCRQSGFTCYGQRHDTKFTLNWTKCFTLPFEFFLNLFVEFAEFNDKNICHYSKRAQTCHPTTSSVRDQDATAAPARLMWETETLKWAQFMLQRFIRFPEFAESSELLLHLGKTPLIPNKTDKNFVTMFGKRLQHRTCWLRFIVCSC